MFQVHDRNRLKDYVLDLASADSRVTAGAVVGSLALSDGDRWSDLDLTFAFAGGTALSDVLEDWTGRILRDFGAIHLFDLPSGPSIYRVFLLPGCLQFDLSFTPAAQFGPVGPKFKLLFGKAVERAQPQPPPARDLFGYAVHHALRARFCIERGRYWQAEYWISSMRDNALHLACLRRGLPTAQGRGFDDLPPALRKAFSGSFPPSLTREALLGALGCVIEGLFYETDGVEEMAGQTRPLVAALSREWEA